MKATHITSNPRSGKLGTINEDDDDDDDDDGDGDGDGGDDDGDERRNIMKYQVIYSLYEIEFGF